MSDYASLTETILTFLRNEYQLQNLDVNEELLHSGMLDSMQLLQLLLFLEQECAISFAPKDLGNVELFSTIHNIAAFIENMKQ